MLWFRWMAAAQVMQAVLWAQPARFERHPIVHGATVAIAGAARVGLTLYTWGEGAQAWELPEGKRRVLLPRAGNLFGEAGCVLDVDADGRADLVVKEGRGIGRLVWLQAPGWTKHEIDTGIETHDVIPAVLFGRPGILLIHRYSQVRFYEIPPKPGEHWPYREIYSIYTPSRQAGLALTDVDGDGRTDIFCGNYWIRSPEEFELPWRLFAINTYNERPLSAMARLASADLRGRGTPDLVAAEGEVPNARLAWFEKPSDPKQLWIEHRLDTGLGLAAPHGLDVADLDGDGKTDIVVGEKNGPRSRLLLFHNEGGGKFRAWTLSEGPPVGVLHAVDLNADGRPDLLVVGPDSIAWWENRTYLRK